MESRTAHRRLVPPQPLALASEPHVLHVGACHRVRHIDSGDGSCFWIVAGAATVDPLAARARPAAARGLLVHLWELRAVDPFGPLHTADEHRLKPLDALRCRYG